MDTSTQYWTRHTVATKKFTSREDSLAFVRWRNGLCLFREELMPVSGHDGKVILDYGCGTGNGLVNFFEFSRPAKVVGADVSPTAIKLSAERLKLHDVGRRMEFQLIKEDALRLPFPNNIFDFICCDGVIHHIPNPEQILHEFQRILKPRGEVRIYAYHYDSIWLHYYVAYLKQIKEGLYRDLPVRKAFQFCTDGPECPISNCYKVDEFLALCRKSGLNEAVFVGAGVLFNEMQWVQSRMEAIASQELGEEHRQFLRKLTFDEFGRPVHGAVVAGSAAFYSYIKPHD